MPYYLLLDNIALPNLLIIDWKNSHRKKNLNLPDQVDIVNFGTWTCTETCCAVEVNVFQLVADIVWFSLIIVNVYGVESLIDIG